MLELNNQIKSTIPQLSEEIIAIKNRIFENPEVDDPLRKSLSHVVELISNVFAFGKLRINSRHEFGNWLDRYKKFEMEQKYFNYFENIISALFKGINELEEFDYLKVRDRAISFFPSTEKYFVENEITYTTN